MSAHDNYRTLTVRGMEFGGGSPRICVPLTAETREQLAVAAANLQGCDYDLVEWRADYYAPLFGAGAEEAGAEGIGSCGAADTGAEEAGAEGIGSCGAADTGAEETGTAGIGSCGAADTGAEEARAAAMTDALSVIRTAAGEHPVLFTIRTKAEGGEASCAPEQYRQLCLTAARSGLADLVDVELFTGAEKVPDFVRQLHEAGVFVIGSSHDFKGTPADEEMLGRLLRMQQAGMDMTKLAVMPVTDMDVIRLLGISVCMREELADRPFITMSMGDIGRISRISGTLTGSAVTFATAGAASAPGQMPAEQVRQITQMLAVTQRQP